MIFSRTTEPLHHRFWRWGVAAALLLALAWPQAQARSKARSKAAAESPAAPQTGKVTLKLQDMALREVFDMLSRQERLNIVLSKGVEGQVSINLDDMAIPQAIQSVAEAAGYAAEYRNGSYFIVDRKDLGANSVAGGTVVRSFKVQYSNPKQVAELLAKHLSRNGKITPLIERNLLLVEDQPEFMGRVEALLKELDAEPKQILIEARILEITLDKNETFGVDWSRVFGSGGTSKLGTQGLANKGSAGLFFNLVNDNLNVYLSALSANGRVQTLSTPRLLALENQQASAVIGDRIGYKVTTTTNQVTSESIQFLDTGVILKVTPSVDQQGRVLMQIHPEVSSATITLGIPSKKSTEVTTQLLCEDGQSIFIGGLIKRNVTRRNSGVPLLREVPGLGKFFSSTEDVSSVTETVVIISPRIVRNAADALAAAPTETLEPDAPLMQPGGLRMDLTAK